MFFDETTPKKSGLKPKLRLAEDVYGRDGYLDATGPAISARERLENARFQKEASPSLLDRIDAITQADDVAGIAREEERLRISKEEDVARIALENEVARIARGEDFPISKPAAVQAKNEIPLSDHDADTRHETEEDHCEPQRHHAPRQNWNSDQSSGAPLVHPVYVINALRKWRHIIAATTILGGLIGVGVAITTPKLYYSSAGILIDPRNFKVVENDINPDVFLSETSMAIIDSQLNVMRSPSVMNKVAQDLTLDQNPEFNGTKKSWLASLNGFSEIMSGGKSEGWEVRTAVKNLYNKTEVSRQQKTFVVNIGAYSEDKQLAADIANKIVEVYLSQRSGGRVDTAKRTSADLQQRLPELKKQVEVTESKVAKFKAENDLFDPQGRSIDDEEILRLNDQLTAARNTTISLNAKADSIKSVTVDGLLTGGLPEEVNSNALNTLRARYTEAKQRYDGLQTKLGPMHPDLQTAGNESASLRASIDAEIKRIRSAIQTELRRAVQTEQALAGRLAELKAKLANSGDALVKLREIEREAASARTVYEQYLLRSQETREQGTIDNSNVSLTNVATASEDPVSTSRKLIALGGILGGFLLGLGLAILSGIWEALKVRYSNSFDGGSPNSPTPYAPKKRTVRGTFQPESAVNTVRLASQSFRRGRSANAQMDKPAAASAQPQGLTPMVQTPVQTPTAAPNHVPTAATTIAPVMVPTIQQPQYVPMPMPMQQPMYVPQQPMFMPQMQMPWFAPQPAMIPQMMMPQMVVPQAAMPQMMAQQPVRPAPNPAPTEAPVQTVADEPMVTQIRSKPLAPNAQLSDIQDSLADMRAELMSLAKQRRRA